MEMSTAPCGDPEQVVTCYADTVYRLAYAYTRAKCDADDVFQEVFARYFRAAPAFESAAHQKAWLLRVTINCAKKLVTSAWFRRRAPLTEDIPFAAPAETGLAEALCALAPPYRSVLHLYYYEGYQTDEIARLLHRKPGTVRTQLVRARAQLAKRLKEAEHV